MRELVGHDRRLAAAGRDAPTAEAVVPALNLARPASQGLKRLCDVAIAALSSLLLAPILLATAAAIRLDSPGPVFFADDRLGRGHRRFRCLKFRTMHVDSDTRLRDYLAGDARARREWARFAKLKSRDPRVTRVGRMLRRTSLDELPQLINVLRGEMSLVGPRPYRPSERARMGTRADVLLTASPGITGLWQVSGRNHLTFEERLDLDERYVRHWSPAMDLAVLLRTAGAVLRGDGAY